MKGCKCYCGKCRESVVMKLYRYTKENKVVSVSQAIRDGFHPNESIKAFKHLLKNNEIKMQEVSGVGGVMKLYTVKR